MTTQSTTPSVTPRTIAHTFSPHRVAGGAIPIEIVGADPSVTARCITPLVPSTIQRIDDAMLVRTLDDSGMQAGLASVGGRTLLFVDGQAVR